jgi:ATP synthase protein I
VAQPLRPEPHERPHPAAPPGQPQLAAVPGRSQLAEPHGRPQAAAVPDPPGLTKPEDRPGLTQPQDRPGLTEPEGRVLLPEPPERPASGMRQVPAFRSRRRAGDRYADKYAGESGNKDADGQTSPLPPRGSGWTVISYLIAGIIAYGGIGWLVSRAVHAPVIFPVGMLFGLGVSLGLVIYRYGRSSSTQNEHAQETLREEPAGDR